MNETLIIITSKPIKAKILLLPDSPMAKPSTANFPILIKKISCGMRVGKLRIVNRPAPPCALDTIADVIVNEADNPKAPNTMDKKNIDLPNITSSKKMTKPKNDIMPITNNNRKL